MRYAEPAEAIEMVRGNEVILFLPSTGMSTGNLTGKFLPVKLPGTFPVGGSAEGRINLLM